MGSEAPSRVHTLLAIQTPSTNWSVPGGAVAGVGRLSDWTGGPPLDVGSLLGAPTAADKGDETRVVVLEAHGEQLPLLAPGTLTLLHTTVEQLLDLPPALRRVAPLVAQVALIDGAPRLFVLDPRGLLEAWRLPQAAAASDVSPSPSR